jgi:hypothetical protein
MPLDGTQVPTVTRPGTTRDEVASDERPAERAVHETPFGDEL